MIIGLVGCALGQRSPYAGSRPPNGYKDKYITSNTNSTPIVSAVLNLNSTQRPPLSGVPIVNSEQNFMPILPLDNGVNLVNRFGADSSNNTQQPTRIPYDAHGDVHLVNYLNQQPIQNRPFWLINYQAIEAHRNGSSAFPAGSPNGGSGSFGK